MNTHQDCINCLICINYCPIQRNPQINLFTYPQTVANIDREKRNPHLQGEIPTLCLTCRLCEIVCPRNIKITKAILKIRATINGKQRI